MTVKHSENAIRVLLVRGGADISACALRAEPATGQQHSVPHVLALRGLGHLDVVEHIPPCFVACPIGSSSDPLALEQIEEDLGNGAIAVVSAAAH